MRQQHNSQRLDQCIIDQSGIADIQLPGVFRSRDQYLLLRAVKDEVKSRLASSLHNAVLLNLGMGSQAEQVHCLGEREIKIRAKPAVAILNDMTITQVFDTSEIQGRLLILGHPGSGKTTTLLDLAKTLVARAEENRNYPIPVLFNLSSWKDDQQLIKDWIVFELRSKYGVSTKLGQRWLQEQIVLPLLDGLDEIAPDRQEICVRRINSFLQEEFAPRYIVVCSRLEEYENHDTALKVNGAVYLKQLSDRQVQNYLTHIGRQELWSFLIHNEELLNFVRTPLFLNIAVLAYPQDEVDQWQLLKRADDPLEYLFDRYVERMLHRQVESRAYPRHKAPSPRQTREWLIWLAGQMERASKTVLLIEDMQPSLFSNEQQSDEPIYVVIYGLLLLLLLVLLCGLIYGLFLWMIYGIVEGLIYGLILGVIGGLFFGLISGLVAVTTISSPDIKVGEVLKWSWADFINGMTDRLIFGLYAGLLIVIIMRLAGDTSGLLDMLMVALSFWLIGGMILGLSAPSDAIKTQLNSDTRRSTENCAMVGLINWVTSGLVLGLTCGLSDGNGVGLLHGMNPEWSNGLIYGLSGGLFFGLMGRLFGDGIPFLQHFTLRLFLYHQKRTPWNYSRFLNYCSERLLLQQVRGRYRFTHKLLQDHFARMPSTLNSANTGRTR